MTVAGRLCQCPCKSTVRTVPNSKGNFDDVSDSVGDQRDHHATFRVGSEDD